MRHTLKIWLAAVRTVRLVGAGVPGDFTSQNLFSFSLTSQQARRLSVDEVDAFLEAAFREYALQLASAPAALWFYSWHDEMSGTLELCAAPADRPEELPFSCDLDICKTPTAVSTAFLKSRYLEGIPWSDLEDSSWEEGSDVEDEEAPVVLTVFARRIPSRIRDQ